MKAQLDAVFVCRTKPAHGAFFVHAREATKQRGVNCLRRYSPNDARVIMVGNTIADYCGEGVTHAAVGNADADFKERAVYVSSAAFTSGVIDILERIIRGEL